MNVIKRLRCHSTDGLFENHWLPYFEVLTQYLTRHRYAPHTVNKDLTCVAHFARWMSQQPLTIQQIDESVVYRFLDNHLSVCDCARPVRRDYQGHRAALKHLLIALRANGLITEPSRTTIPVDEELLRFNDHMNQVHGLALTTRKLYLRPVRHLLSEQFGDRPVVMSTITPTAVRQFVARESERYTTPASVGSVVSALRGYFRFRAFRGDQVHHLIGVVFYPANWQLASLPKTLSHAEIQCLLKVLDDKGPSARRTKAVVRCALDLGLRSGEIATLKLDDIDWQAGTLTLRRTKSRRDDILPLPDTTGQALADYLQFERPPTTHRAVFVRHVAPRDQPISPDLIRKVIRQAFARAELPYTRSHLLRHTLANRLVASGSSLKEVADVLRHRSLNTTLIYAKLDSKNLSAVALPWPGSAS